MESKRYQGSPIYDHFDRDYEMDNAEDLEDTIEMVNATHKNFIGNLDTFQKLLEDPHKPLYKSCKKSTKLSALVNLLNLKAKSEWTDTSFTKILKLFAEMLSEDNKLPLSMQKAMKKLSMFKLGYEKIHACLNDCILL